MDIGAIEQKCILIISLKRMIEMKKEGNKRADDFFKNVKVFFSVQNQFRHPLILFRDPLTR